MGAYFDPSVRLTNHDLNVIVDMSPLRFSKPITLGYDTEVQKLFVRFEMYALVSLPDHPDISTLLIRARMHRPTQSVITFEGDSERGTVKRPRK